MLQVDGLSAPAMYEAAANAAQAAPPVRRRYWLQLRAAVAVLWDRLRVPQRNLPVDTDRPRQLAERGVRVSATLCMAACRNAGGVTPPERRALDVLRLHTGSLQPVTDAQAISDWCASA